MLREASAFVSARDSSFWRHGQPYRFVGANLWYGLLLDPGRMVRELDRLKVIGVLNLRVLASVEDVNPVSAHATPTVQPRAGVYDEVVLAGLDRLLYEVRAQPRVNRGMPRISLLVPERVVEMGPHGCSRRVLSLCVSVDTPGPPWRWLPYIAGLG